MLCWTGHVVAFSWFQAARRGGLENPLVLEGPRADRFPSDKSGLLLPGEAPQRLAERNFALSGSRPACAAARLAGGSGFLGHRSIPAPSEKRGSTSLRPELGFRGWKNLLAADPTAFPPDGKTGTRRVGISPGREGCVQAPGNRFCRKMGKILLDSARVSPLSPSTSCLSFPSPPSSATPPSSAR